MNLGDNSLFVEGKIGIGTLEPKSDLDNTGNNNSSRFSAQIIL